MTDALSQARRLTAEEREFLRSEVARKSAEKARAKKCLGCGTPIAGGSRKRYCTIGCANRHWHVRKKDAARAALGVVGEEQQ